MATTIQSGYANSPKLTADVASRAEVYGGRGLVFDGVADYLDCGDLTSTTRSNMTISFWFYRNVSGTIHICSRDDESSNRNWSIYIYNNFINFDCNISNAGKNTVGATAIPVGSWTHLAFTHNGSNQAWYVNGKLDGTSSHSGAIDNDSINMYIGRRAGNYLNGSISDFKVYSSALTEAEVQLQYLKPESVPSPSTLVAWYPMCEANPESPQSIVYDHSEKKLGSESISGTNWGSVSGITVSNGSLIFNTSTQFTNIQDSPSVISGKLYKVVFTVSNYVSGSVRPRLGGTFGTEQNANGTYTEYIIPAGTYTAFYAYTNGSNNFTIENISIKEVLMGNHATTNFFGDELITNSADREFTSNTGFWNLSGSTITGNKLVFSNNSALNRRDGLLTNSKNYQVIVDVSDYTSGSFKVYAHGTQSSAISSQAVHTVNITAGTSNTSFAFNCTGFTGSINSVSVKEVGISSTGFTTAQNEPVIPQIPLVKYNEKLRFNGNDGSGSEVLWENIGGAFASTKFSFSLTHYGQNTDTIQTILDITEGTYTDYLKLYRNAGGRYYVYLENSNTAHTIYQYGAYADDAKFNHIVFTCDGSTWNFYINGVLTKTDSKSNTTAPLSASHTDMRVGMDAGGSESYRAYGIVDELSLWNHALTQAEVNELFADSVIKDATTHSKSGNLLGYWRNDGVSTWQDRRGWSYLNFDGINDEVVTNAITSLTDATYTFWAKSSETGENGGVFGNGGQHIGGFHFNFSSNRPLLYMGGSRYRYWNDTSAQDDGAWHYFAVVLDADDIYGCKFYVDGVEQTVNFTSNGTATAYTEPLHIGYDGGSRSCNIDIAQFAVYSDLKNTPFLLNEFNQGINADHSSNSNLLAYFKFDNATTVKDLSGNGNHGTTSGNPTLNTGNTGNVAGTPDSITIREGLNSNKDGLGFPLKNPSGNVLRLNGSSEYVKANFTNTTYSVYTISCWIKANSLSNWIRIIQVDSSNERYLGLHGDGKVISSYYSGSWSALYTTATLSTDRWYYLTLVDDDTQTKIYIDDGSPETLANSIQITNPYLYIGTHEGNGNFFDGLVDEVKFYNRELSATEIQKNYKHGKGKHKND